MNRNMFPCIFFSIIFSTFFLKLKIEIFKVLATLVKCDRGMVQIQKFRGETEKTLSTLAHYIISDDPKPSDVEIAFLLKSKMI